MNDTPEDARRLVRLLGNIRCKVNLIPLNEAAGIAFTRPSDERVNAFARILADAGLTVSVRKSRGRDIRAACGQLIVEGTAKSTGAEGGGVALGRFQVPVPGSSSRSDDSRQARRPRALIAHTSPTRSSPALAESAPSNSYPSRRATRPRSSARPDAAVLRAMERRIQLASNARERRSRDRERSSRAPSQAVTRRGARPI